MSEPAVRARFESRAQAARLLAVRLGGMVDERPLVLGVPAGGEPMAEVLAAELGGEGDVVLVHKLESPHNPELAIGSVDEHGTVLLNELGRRGVPADWVRREVSRQLGRLRQRRFARGDAPGLHAAGRTVVVVDDGAASGATMSAALALVRRQRPRRLIAALPVAPSSALAELEWLADEVVCLSTPPEFEAIRAFYRDFSPPRPIGTPEPARHQAAPAAVAPAAFQP